MNVCVPRPERHRRTVGQSEREPVGQVVAFPCAGEHLPVTKERGRPGADEVNLHRARVQTVFDDVGLFVRRLNDQYVDGSEGAPGSRIHMRRVGVGRGVGGEMAGPKAVGGIPFPAHPITAVMFESDEEAEVPPDGG